MKDILVTEISEPFHKLAGRGTVEYLYDKKQEHLTINVNGNEVAVYTGLEAKEIYLRITDSEFEKKFTRNCLMRNECFHVVNLRKSLKPETV